MPAMGIEVRIFQDHVELRDRRYVVDQNNNAQPTGFAFIAKYKRIDGKLNWHAIFDENSGRLDAISLYKGRKCLVSFQDPNSGSNPVQGVQNTYDGDTDLNSIWSRIEDQFFRV